MIGSKGHNKRFLQISFISAMLCFAALALLATEFHGFYHQGLDSAKVSQAKHKRSPGSPTYSECVSQLTFQSTNGRLYVNGIPFDLKGLNWFGMEDTDMVPEGCSGYYSNIPTCYAFYFNFIQSNGFNALRFPLALDAIDNNYAINQYPFNSSWKYLDILTNFVETAADYGLLIMLDFHLIYHGTQIPDLWNDTTFSNTKITQLIQKVIDLYDNQWNILAIDLKNEPHGTASWGDGKSTDWRLASQQFANYLYANQPTWLAFVEGVEGNTAGVTSTYSGQWGGNLIGAVDFPLEVTDPSRLVYSVHVYGPDVTTQSYFNAPNYPANLPAIWQQQWGFCQRSNRKCGCARRMGR
jgi:endoglucanase